MAKEYGYEYDAVFDIELDVKTANKCVFRDRDIYLLRSGRDALKAVARECSNYVVLLPALACDSMVLPFEMYGNEVVFYKLNSDYSADFDHLSTLIKKQGKKVLLLYMSYFGNQSLTDEQLDLLKKKHDDTVFVEDRTHDLIYPKQHKFVSDYTVASLRKWINVPDGGLMWATSELEKDKFSDDTTFSKERRYAQCMRHEYFKNGDELKKSEYRKIFSTVTNQIDIDPNPCKMSAYAYEMARCTDWEKVRKIREENAGVLLEVLEKNDKLKFIQPHRKRSNLYVPIMVDDRDNLQSKLSAKGIFTTLIWPLSDKQKEVCPVAENTEKHMLGIPCDQRYTSSDMHFIAEEILKTMHELT